MVLPRTLLSLAIIVPTCCSLSTTQASAAEVTQDFELAYSFVRDELIGKTLELKTTAIIASGKVETEFYRRRSFTGLVRTSDAFAFEVVSVISQKNYDISEAGERLPGPPTIKDRVVVVRYEVTQALSTGQLIGVARTTLNTERDPTGSAKSLRVRCSDNRLIVATKDVLYGDHFAARGERKPGVTEMSEEYWKEAGKLHGKITDKSVQVDPDSLAQAAEPTVNVAEESEAQ